MKCYGFLYIVQKTIQFGYCCRKEGGAETHQIRMSAPLDSESLFSLNLLETTKEFPFSVEWTCRLQTLVKSMDDVLVEDGLQVIETNLIPISSLDELSCVCRRKLIQIVCRVVSIFAKCPIDTMIVFYSDNTSLPVWRVNNTPLLVYYLSESLFYVHRDYNDAFASQTVILFNCQEDAGDAYVTFANGSRYTDNTLSLHDSDVVDSFREMAIQQFKQSFDAVIAPTDLVYKRLTSCCAEAVKHLQDGDQRVSITLKYAGKSLKVYFTRNRLLASQRAQIRHHILEVLRSENGKVDEKLSVVMYGSGSLYDTIMSILKEEPLTKSMTIVERTRMDGDKTLCSLLDSLPPVYSVSPLFVGDKHQASHGSRNQPLSFQSVLSQGGCTVLDEDTDKNVTTLALTRLKQDSWSGLSLLLCRQEGVPLQPMSSDSHDWFVSGVVPFSFFTSKSSLLDDNYVFVGTYEAGHRHGPCVVSYLTKPIQYSAECCLDERTGEGEVCDHGQRIWKGEYLTDYPEGFGWSYNHSTACRYIGDYSSGEQHGVGCELEEGREVRCSCYRDGFIRGRSLSFSNDGSLVDGMINHDLLQGYGLLLESDGSVSFGVWKDGLLEGIGEKFSSTGLIEYGEFKSGLNDGIVYVTDQEDCHVALYSKGKEVDASAETTDSSSEERGEDSLESRWVAVVDRLFSTPTEDALEEQLERELDELMGLYGEGEELYGEDESVDNKELVSSREEESMSSTNKEESASLTNNDDSTQSSNKEESMSSRDKDNSTQSTNKEESTSSHDQTDKSHHHSVHSSLVTPLSIYADSSKYPLTDMYYLQDWMAEYPSSLPFDAVTIQYTKTTSARSEGILYYQEHIVYRGEFKEGQFDGEGVVYYPNGNKSFEGNFKDGLPHGYCVSFFKNECIEYKGEWKNGVKDGDGYQYRKVNLQYCNSVQRQFFMEKASNSALSFAKGFDPFSIDSYIDYGED